MIEMKSRILEKAEELFYKYGVRSITMDEIAAQLGISKKTIYLSFADKDELVLEVFDKYMKKSKSDCLIDQQKADDAVQEIFLALDIVSEMLLAMNASVLYDLEKYYPATFKKFRTFKYEFLYNVVSENLKRGIAEELFRSDLNVDIITRMRLGTMLISLNTEVFQQGKYNLLEVEREIVVHYLYGVATAKGAKLIQKYNLQRHKNKA